MLTLNTWSKWTAAKDLLKYYAVERAAHANESPAHALRIVASALLGHDLVASDSRPAYKLTSGIGPSKRMTSMLGSIGRRAAAIERLDLPAQEFQVRANIAGLQQLVDAMPHGPGPRTTQVKLQARWAREHARRMREDAPVFW